MHTSLYESSQVYANSISLIKDPKFWLKLESSLYESSSSGL
jgi:hypothetical protein